jgi:hypothetical protein
MAAETRGLWRLSANFMMCLLQVVPALKEPSAERVAAVAATISIKTELHGDEDTHWQTLLAECTAGNVPSYLYTPAKQRCYSLFSLHAFKSYSRHFASFFFCLDCAWSPRRRSYPQPPPKS